MVHFQLIKVDVLKKTYDTWMEKNAYPSEPIFLPRPNSQVYDDDVQMCRIKNEIYQCIC